MSTEETPPRQVHRAAVMGPEGTTVDTWPPGGCHGLVNIFSDTFSDMY